MKGAVAEYTRDLAWLVRSRMPLDAALDFMASQAPDASLRESSLDMARRVRNGESLAGAAKGRGTPFGAFYCNLIGLGERSESLPEILDRLADYLDSAQRLRARCREALVYPTAVLAACLCIGIFLNQYILPTFWSLEAFGSSGYGYDYIGHLMETAPLVALALAGLLSAPASAGLRWRLPVVGALWRNAAYASACRGLSLALAGGSSVPAAVRMAAETATGSLFRAVLMEVARRCDRGMPLSEAMRLTPGFPRSVAEASAAGEQSERLPTVLAESAELYERLVDYQGATLVILLEPMALLGVGVVVAAQILSFWGPWYHWIARITG